MRRALQVVALLCTIVVGAASIAVIVTQTAWFKDWLRGFIADVCGPSNIGNLLAARGVPTVCAPGVSFGNMHAADEWADIASIGPVYTMYCDAALRFLSRP